MKKKKIVSWLIGAILAVFVLVFQGILGGNEDPGMTSGAAQETESVRETGDELETIESESEEPETQESTKTPETTKAPETTSAPETTESETLDEHGSYTSKEDVALYLYLYGHLPDNFITKSEAQNLGWESSEGNLWKVAPGMSIGGDKFGNREGLLPKASGRQYYECDIDSDGKYRNAKRIVFSNDGLIYYTEDHYESFELLYEK